MSVTGARKRQRLRESSSDGNEVLPEEPRRQGAPRRKVNRVPNFTSRRKTTPPPEAAVTRIPPRRRLKPFRVEEDQETVGFETERPEIFLQQEVEEEEDEGISVQPVSTVRFSRYSNAIRFIFSDKRYHFFFTHCLYLSFVACCLCNIASVNLEIKSNLVDQGVFILIQY